MTERKRRYLQIALGLIGGIFLLLYPLMQIWPSGWVWLPRQQEYEQMMIGVYATLGIFLIWASRRPEAHFSLLDLVRILVKFSPWYYHGRTSHYGSCCAGPSYG